MDRQEGILQAAWHQSAEPWRAFFPLPLHRQIPKALTCQLSFLSNWKSSLRKRNLLPMMVWHWTSLCLYFYFFLIAFLSLFNVLFKGVDGVPRRSYCRTRDTFAVITVYQESSSLTSRKIRTVLTEKQTKVAKQSLNPKFNYSVLLSVASYVDLKSMKARVSIMDRDRLIKTSTIGSAIIQLKHLKPLLVSPDALEMVVTGKPTKKQVTISLLIEKE